MEPLRFPYKNSDRVQYGMSAQAVKDILPDIVVTFDHEESEDGVSYAIEYTNIIPVLINAVKQQQHAISGMQRSIADLQKSIADLQGLVAASMAKSPCP